MPRCRRGIQYAAAYPFKFKVCGMLDHPLSRMMTAVLVVMVRVTIALKIEPHLFYRTC